MKKLIVSLLLILLAPVVRAQTASTYYTVPTIAALKALTTRPSVVQTVDANPGVFNWSTTPCSAADDIFQVTPTAGPAGCYVRMGTPYAVGKSATLNGVLVTNGSGVPSISTTLPAIDASSATVTSSGGSQAISLASRFAQVTNVRDFGATGDGSTDDGVAIAAAITAAPTGGAVFFPVPATCYKITAAISVTKSLTLFGTQSKICQATADTSGIVATASDVHIDALWLSGPVSATYQASATAIRLKGTFNAGSAPTYITQTSVQNTRIQGWGAYGILAEYVDQFLLQSNYVNDVGYAGIGVVSGKNCRIDSNTIDTVGPGTSGNAYGIFLSRATGDAANLTSQPRTTNCVVSSNTVSNIPIWEGIDSHAAEQHTVINNVVYNTLYGISIGASVNNLGVATYAPLNVSVTGNIVESGVTDGSRGYGIIFQGVTGAGEKATGAIVGNAVKNYGDQSNASGGAALQIYGTAGLSVSGNSIINPSWIGINVYTDNIGISVIGNSIIDPWSNSVGVGEADCIVVYTVNNTATIDGNTCQTNGKSATYLITTATGSAIKVANVSGNAVQLGVNYSVATTYVNDPGSKVSTTFKGGTLASAAFQSTGTSGATLPFLNGANTWSALQSFVGNYLQDGYALHVESTNGNGYSGALGFYVTPSGGGGPYAAASVQAVNTNNSGATDGGQLLFKTAAQDGSHTLNTALTITHDKSASALGTWTFSNTTKGLAVSANQNATTLATISNTDTTNSSSRAALSITGGTVAGAVTAIHGIGFDVGTTSADDLRLVSGGSARWQINGTSYEFLASVDNTYDIGRTATFRPRSGYFGTSVTAPTITATTTLSSVAASFTGASVVLSGLASDATHTDATLCKDTTSNTLLVGSGAAGICLGTSSLRYKTNVVALRAGLDQIDALQPVSYRYKKGYGTTDRDLYGFTAEQVYEVMPQLVGLDKDGRPNSVDWAGVVPVLVNAVKELKAANDNLAGQIERLKRAR